MHFAAIGQKNMIMFGMNSCGNGESRKTIHQIEESRHEFELLPNKIKTGQRKENNVCMPEVHAKWISM